jgi:hypothetical protein
MPIDAACLVAQSLESAASRWRERQPRRGRESQGDASFSLSTNVVAGTETSNALTGSRQVCDVAGNCAATTGPFGPFMVDLEPPTITITTPANNDAFILAQAVPSNYGCNDGGSGVATCTGTVATARRSAR